MGEDAIVQKVVAEFSDAPIANLISKQLGTVPHGAHAFQNQMVTFKVIQ
jgi:hypothetical protein